MTIKSACNIELDLLKLHDDLAVKFYGIKSGYAGKFTRQLLGLILDYIVNKKYKEVSKDASNT